MPQPDPNFDPDFASPAEWATEYRKCGLQVIPCLMPGKRPLLSEWRSLQNELVPDTSFLRWYHPTTGEHRTRYDMGLIAGAASGRLLVLDLDTNPKALQWWDGICHVHNNGMQLETPRQKTGGGGQHLLFRVPANWVPPTGTTSIGVDVRGQGGFAVMPPSRHGSGRSYEWFPGQAPWEMTIAEAPAWLLEEIDKLFGAIRPKTADPQSAPGQHDRTPPPKGEFTDFGKQTDGREDKMTRMVWRVIVKLYRHNPIRPTAAQERQLMEEEYAVWDRTIDPKVIHPGETRQQALEREERGPTEWSKKWRHAMSQWDVEVSAAAKEPDPSPEEPDLASEFNQTADAGAAKAKADPSRQYPYLNVKQIKAQPDPVWLVDQLISEKIVGFIFGTYGTLKTFIGIDIGLSIATGRPTWWGRKLNRQGAVIYICVEGSNRLKYRLQAWESHRGVNADDHPFFLIEKTINFMSGDDIGRLEATVQAVKDEAKCEIAAVFVDTVSRVLPGAKENQQEHMSLFVGACDRIRERFSTTVIGVHHTNKEGLIRGSSVIPAAGDFLLEIRRQPGEMFGTIHAHKVKDAEDGWEERFTVTKVPVGVIGGRVSLVADKDENPAASKGGWPEKDTLRKVLDEIQKAWLAGKPWSASPQSRDRYAARIMWIKFSIETKISKGIVETWLITGVLADELVNSHSKTRGLKVTGTID